MKILTDIINSIKGNAKTRVNDPIIGAFVLSWCLCNWDKLAVLFWGSKTLEERVSEVTHKMAILERPSLLISDSDLLIIPIVLTFSYIFLLPKLAQYVDEKLSNINKTRYEYAIDTEIEKETKRKELNKVLLRADPANEFLAQEVKIDLEREKAEVEIRFSEAEEAKNRQIESKARATREQRETELSELKQEIEKRSLMISSSKQKAMLASHKFPSIYLFMKLLSDSLKEDGICMTVDSIANCVAIVFGYEDFKELLEDKNFNNESFEKLKYILIDADYLIPNFSEIIENEGLTDIDSENLIGHFEYIFDELPYEFVYPELLAEKINYEIEVNSNELFNLEGVSAGMAETDTIFDHVDELVIDKYMYDSSVNGFAVSILGSASGSHRKEPDVAGQGINISVEAVCKSVVGKYGLKEYEFDAHATPEIYE